MGWDNRLRVLLGLVMTLIIAPLAVGIILLFVEYSLFQPRAASEPPPAPLPSTPVASVSEPQDQSIATAEVVVATATAEATSVPEVPQIIWTNSWGPYDGELVHSENGEIAPVWCQSAILKNFTTEVTFYNPYDGEDRNWSYGLLFRRTGFSAEYRLTINASGRVGFGLLNGSGDGKVLWEEYPKGVIDTSPGGHNTVFLGVEDGVASLTINGGTFYALPVAEKQEEGAICVATGLLGNDTMPGAVTRYEGFIVRRI